MEAEESDDPRVEAGDQGSRWCESAPVQRPGNWGLWGKS